MNGLYTAGGSGGSGALKKTLLWENPNPTASFTTTTLNGIDFSAYDYVSVVMIAKCGQNVGEQESIFKLEYGKNFCVSVYNANATYPRYVRSMSFTANSVTISSVQAGGYSGIPASTSGIPMKIYGIKGKIE